LKNIFYHYFRADIARSNGPKPCPSCSNNASWSSHPLVGRYTDLVYNYHSIDLPSHQYTSTSSVFHSIDIRLGIRKLPHPPCWCIVHSRKCLSFPRTRPRLYKCKSYLQNI